MRFSSAPAPTPRPAREAGNKLARTQAQAAGPPLAFCVPVPVVCQLRRLFLSPRPARGRQQIGPDASPGSRPWRSAFQCQFRRLFLSPWSRESRPPPPRAPRPPARPPPPVPGIRHPLECASRAPCPRPQAPGKPRKALETQYKNRVTPAPCGALSGRKAVRAVRPKCPAAYAPTGSSAKGRHNHARHGAQTNNSLGAGEYYTAKGPIPVLQPARKLAVQRGRAVCSNNE
jgi:hypothetical protein